MTPRLASQIRNPKFAIRTRLLLTAFCLLLLLITHHASLITAVAQSATATLSGTVEDQNGAVIPGAAIVIQNTATSLKREVTTSDNGSFAIPLLPPGTYTITVRRDGFTPLEVRNVVLNVGDQKALQIQLKAGDVNAQVTVDSNAETIRTDAAVGTVVDQQFAARIPLNGRSFQSLITLTPGVVLTPSSNNFNGQFSVNGQRPEANSFSVDGVSVNIATVTGAALSSQTSGNIPAMTALGTTQSLVSVDALQEFKVQTSSYSAEYGRQPGGQISILTRSGTNQFHGSLYNYFRNDVLDANNWFANNAGRQRAPLRQNDFGGTFSGPVFLPRFGEGGRLMGYDGFDRTFFFFSYEGLRLRQPQFGLANYPTTAFRQAVPPALQPLLNAFPLPTGKDLGNGMAEFPASFSNPSEVNATSVRVDHTIARRWVIFGRYNDVPSQTDVRELKDLSVIRNSGIHTRSATLGLTAPLNAQILNELRFNYSNNKANFQVKQDNFGGAVPLAVELVVPPAQFGAAETALTMSFFYPGFTAPPGQEPSIGIFGDRTNFASISQWQVVEGLSYGVGSHQLKFGFDYRRLAPVSQSTKYILSFTFQSQQDVLNSRSTRGSTTQRGMARPLYTNFSAYAQDIWKVSRRLTLDLGLRWELNPSPAELGGNYTPAVTQIRNLSTMQLAPKGTALWKTTFNNFAPRVGIAYQVSQATGRETMLRAGFGVFYDTGNNEGSNPFQAFRVFSSSQPALFPLSPAQATPPPLPTSLTPPYPQIDAFDPSLKLPYTLQWNVAVERSVGKDQVLTASYVGAAGRRLLQLRQLSLSAINAAFTSINLVTNRATSDYGALQIQYHRRLSRGLQALASYTWSHAIDDDSTSRSGFSPKRGNVAFDVRHNFTAALTYNIPSPSINRFADEILHHWSVDARVYARSALPVDLVAAFLTDPADGSRVAVRPNLFLGVPLYVNDSNLPGGRKINRAAFSVPITGQQGNLGRNVVRGLGAWQVDLAFKRKFDLSERVNLQFRAEGFNLLNHPNFGSIQTSLSAANFGQATNMLNTQLGGLSALYQIGGPRSMQLALRLEF